MPRKILIGFTCLIFSACSSPYFKALEGSGNCPVLLEVRKQQGFELRFINMNKNNIKGLNLTFDNKYKHSLSGLYSVEKGLIKDSVFKAGDTLTFKFTEDLDNSIYFNINERDYNPNEIMLNNNECSTKWILK
jgi:hypothetical protein